MCFVQPDWFLYLGISCTFHLGAKRWRPVLFQLRNYKIVIKNEVSVLDKTKKVTYVLLAYYLLFSDKDTQKQFKMFCLQMTSGRQPDVP